MCNNSDIVLCRKHVRLRYVALFKESMQHRSVGVVQAFFSACSSHTWMVSIHASVGFTNLYYFYLFSFLLLCNFTLILALISSYNQRPLVSDGIAFSSKSTNFVFVLQMFSVGPAFRGLKMIPPGPHFVYYSSSNRSVFLQF